MANHGLIVGLDVGTNTVKVLVADVRNQQVNIIAVGRTVSHGVKRGMVVDIEATAKDIQAALDQVVEQTGVQVSEVIANIHAADIQMQHVSGTISVQDSQHISYADVQAAVDRALQIPLAGERTVIDLQPTEFVVDDFDGVQDPNDMVGVHLTMKGLAYIGARPYLTNLRAAIERAGLTVRDFVLAPLAYTQTIPSDAEQDFGTILMDMGASRTTAMIVQDHQVKYISTFPAGSDNITRDISTVLNIGVHDADELKLNSGVATAELANAKNQLTLNVVGKETPMQISEAELAEIIQARVEQIVGKLGDRLTKVSGFEMPGGVIITGGGVALRGIETKIASEYGVKVRLFSPSDIGLGHPGYAGAWSIVHYAAQQSQVELIVKQALYGLPLTFAQARRTTVQPVRESPKAAKAKVKSEKPVTEPISEAEPQEKISLWERIKRVVADSFEKED